MEFGFRQELPSQLQPESVGLVHLRPGWRNECDRLEHDVYRRQHSIAVAAILSRRGAYSSVAGVAFRRRSTSCAAPSTFPRPREPCIPDGKGGARFAGFVEETAVAPGH